MRCYFYLNYFILYFKCRTTNFTGFCCYFTLNRSSTIDTLLPNNVSPVSQDFVCIVFLMETSQFKFILFRKTKICRGFKSIMYNIQQHLSLYPVEKPSKKYTQKMGLYIFKYICSITHRYVFVLKHSQH